MKTKILLILMLVSFVSLAQKSPRQQAEGTIGSAKVSVDYSSPRVKGRTVYGGLVKYDMVWRAGADTNTTVAFNNDVTVNGKKLAAGKYGFFIIPTENGQWSAIFNTKNDAWGAYSYKESEDAIRVQVKAKSTKENVENLTYKVNDKTIEFSWADKYFEIKIGK